MATAESNKISLTTAIVISVNAMFGAGIFLLPGKMASQCGPAGILTTFFVAAAVWLIGYCVARVAANVPGEGSFYLYTKQWGGHRLGLIVSSLYIIGLTIAIGLIFNTAGTYLQHYFPTTNPLFLSAIVWTLVIALNISGAKLSSIGQKILIFTTLVPLLLTTILCFTKANFTNLIPFAPYGYKNVLFASRLVIFSFFGFEAVAALAAHVREPQRTLPRALMIATAVVGFIYVCFLGSLFLSISASQFVPGETITHALAHLFPSSAWLLELINIAILSALIGCSHSMVWSISSLTLSLFKTFNNSLGIAARSNTATMQQIAVLLVGLGSLASCMFLNADQAFYFTALFVVTAYTATIRTFMTIKKERTLTNTIIAILALAAASMILGFAIDGIITSVL